MWTLVDSCPPGGPILDFIGENDMWANLQECPYLTKCAKQPEVLWRVRRRMPFKSRPFVDPFFLNYLVNHPLPVKVPYHVGRSVQDDDAFVNALAKNQRIRNEPVWNDNWVIAEKWLHDIVVSVVGSSSVVPVTRVYREMNQSTAPGPILRKIFENSEFMINSSFGRKFIAEYIEQSSSLWGAFTLHGAHLKDELRLSEKILQKKTRLFLCAPKEHFVALQTLCLDFNDKMNQHAGKFFSCVGIPMYGTFHHIATRLLDYPHRVVGDYNGWETSVRPIHQLSCAWLRFCCLAPQYRTVYNFYLLTNLYRDVLYTPVVLPDGTIIEMIGQPSGFSNTAHDNTLINFMVLCYCWLDNGGPADLDLFKRSVLAFLFGDDNILGVSEYAFRFFNPDSIRCSLDKIGFEMEFSPSLEFLGHFIQFDLQMQRYVPVFPMYKALGSLLFGGFEHDLSKCVDKAMSIRVLVFTNREIFDYVDAYCHYLVENFDKNGDKGFRSKLLSIHNLEMLHCVSEFSELKDASARIKEHCKDLIVFHCRMNGSVFGNSLPGQGTLATSMPDNALSTTKRKRKRNRRKRGKPPSPSSGQSRAIIPVKPVKPKSATVPYGSLVRTVQRRGNVGGGKNSSVPTCCVSDTVQAVVAMMTDPHNNPHVRLPDRSWHTNTALVYSVRFVNVYANMSDVATEHVGKFSIAINAHMGSFGQVSGYKIAMVNSVPTWPNTQFGQATAYTQFSAVDGGDIRIDPNRHELLGNEKCYYRATGSTDPVVVEGPFGPILTESAENYLFSFRYTSAAGVSTFFPPAGNFYVNISIRGLQADMPTACVLAFQNCIATVVRNDFFAGSATTGANQYIEFFLSTGESAGTSQQSFTLTMGAGSTYTATSIAYINVNSTAPATTQALLSTGYAEYINGGNVEQYRPLACSALFTCMTSGLVTGGDIAADLVVGDTVRSAYFTNVTSNSVGHLQEYYNLAARPSAYDGKLKDGAYVFWAPGDEDDIHFFTPQGALAHDYQNIVISGQFTPTGVAALSGSVLVGRLMVTSVYEIQTETTLFGVQSPVGSSPVFDEIMAILARCPKAMPNGPHVEWLRNLMLKLKNAGRNAFEFWNNNKSWIVPAAQGIAALV